MASRNGCFRERRALRQREDEPRHRDPERAALGIEVDGTVQRDPLGRQLDLDQDPFLRIDGEACRVRLGAVRRVGLLTFDPGARRARLVSSGDA